MRDHGRLLAHGLRLGAADVGYSAAPDQEVDDPQDQECGDQQLLLTPREHHDVHYLR